MLDTPILFLVFNRPDTTVQVFEQIRRAAPRQLFIAADGPRPDRPEDVEKCQLVREIVANTDWNCEVKTLFREKNLGCGVAVSEAITWFFDNVEQGIILEDDTLPNPSFFPFCSEMLDLYKQTEIVMHISGTNFLKKFASSSSYYCSVYPNIWGWASWSRAWKKYSYDLSEILNFDSVVNHSQYNFNKREIKYWKETFLNVKDKRTTTWDYQWLFCVWKHSGICITPVINLVSNMGFGRDGTHTHNSEWEIANLPNYSMDFPLKHIENIIINKKKDRKTFKALYGVPTSLPNKLRNLSYKILPYEKRKRYLGI